MEPSPQGSTPFRLKRVFEELVRGQGYAKELMDIYTVGDNPDSESDRILRDLVEKVRGSFDICLSVMRQGEFEEVSRAVTVAHRPMKRGKPNASEDSEGSVRSSLPTPRNRGGCYKRRSNGETWTEFTPSMNDDDDHQWRKYGQKSILNAAHPRNYFRCTHKSDQGCMATKHVQKISDDPITFRTVYIGRHTCKDDRRLKSIEIVSDNDGSNNLGNRGSPVLIRFERNDMIGAPLKNEETSDVFFGNIGAVVPSVSSDKDNFNISGPGGDISIISSDPGDVMFRGQWGSYLDGVIGGDDTADFVLDFGSAGDV